jgi:glycosyltransferase involved in cell wall biosynthesis
MKIVICTNSAWNLVNFRSGLIRALVAQGHEVLAVSPNDEYASRLMGLGCRFIALPMDSQGANPGRDLLLLFRFLKLLHRERPDVFLGYTIKPNIYGSLAAGFLKIPVVNNIAGLGAVFISAGCLVHLVRVLYRVALSRSAKVFFQNDDDRTLFINAGLVRAKVTDLLPGSGIDLTRFNCNRDECEKLSAVRNDATRFRFLLIARMLWDKGVGEYVAAAKLLRARYPQVECCLLGFVDALNPAAISRAEMDAWVEKGDVMYLGVSDDVRVEIATADCIVLPSYREGVPRALLEAAAMGVPIITTDTVGCRDVVDDGINGYLCKVCDAEDLAKKMFRMIELTVLERNSMGIAGRKKMECKFDEKIVIQKYLTTLNTFCHAN